VSCTDLRDNDGDSSFDCWTESDCRDRGQCVPGATPLGGACTSQLDCQASADDPFCFVESLGGFAGGACSEFCTIDVDCLGDGVCVPYADPTDLVGTGTIGLCFRRCDDDGDCRDGTQVCELAPHGVDALACVPAPVCGNNYFEWWREECEDGNLGSGDGCSSTCQLEACDLGGFPALAIGTVSGDTRTSTSDDFATRCSDWTYMRLLASVATFTPPSPGRLYVRATTDDVTTAVSVRATCDSMESELGCAGTSTVAADISDTAYVIVGTIPSAPYELEVAFRPAVCGDSLRSGDEVCDGVDVGTATCADLAPGTIGRLSCVDCASLDASSCVAPTINEGTDNNVPPASVDTWHDPYVGSFDSDDDRDCVAVPLSAGDRMTAHVHDLGDGACLADELLPVVLIYDVDGTTEVTWTFTCDSAPSTTATVSGTYFVCVENANGWSTGERYQLVVDVAPPRCNNGIAEAGEACDVLDRPLSHCTQVDPATSGRLGPLCSEACTVDTSTCAIVVTTETEPTNDTVAGADLYADGFTGRIASGTDQDCVRVTGAVAGQRLIATTIDFDDGACEALLADTVLDVYRPPSTNVIASDFNNGAGHCSLVTVALSSPGDYVVCVAGTDADDLFNYRLDIELQDQGCGGGFVDGAEECDDGNTVEGDGCDASCHAEGCAAPLAASEGSQLGDTAGGGALLEGSCTGSGAREDVWRYLPSATGSLAVTVRPVDSDYDMGVYVRATCATDDTELACEDTFGNGHVETLVVPAEAGTPIFIFVDGYYGNDLGPYTLTLTPL